MNRTSGEAGKKSMVTLRNKKGFSLIEIAIVLIVIGIIIAAVIKGQDLIASSQSKKVIATSQQWRNLTMAFFDRNGRFPGDQNKNGIIGDQAGEQTAALAANAEIVAVMEQTPDNPLILGSTSFYMYLANVQTSAGINRNALVVCGDISCANALSLDQLEMIKAVDTAIDGNADAGLGTFRSFTTALTMLPAPPTSVSNRYSATVDSILPVNSSAAGTTLAWATTYRGAVWLFDKSF